MRFVIYANFDRENDFNVADTVASVLKAEGQDCFFACDRKPLFDLLPILDINDLIADADILVVLGGDGTVLNAVKYLRGHAIPLVGVNLGKLGFLTEIEVADIKRDFGKIVRGKYFVEDRAMLEVDIGSQKLFALNEVVLTKGVNTRPIKIRVEYDGKFLDRYLADGLIISTPTGSTAYSLSCGGPILGPDIEAIIINPVCAHSLHSRALVMADTHTIGVCAEELYINASVVIDGCTVAEVAEGGTLTVKKSAQFSRFIKLQNISFYDKLLKKLNYWSVTSADQ